MKQTLRCFSTPTSTWANVPLGPRDAILGISEAFRADPSPVKINLGVGAYRDDKGKPLVLDCVQKAEALIPQVYKDKEYSDISGLKEFNDVSVALAYGPHIGLPAENVGFLFPFYYSFFLFLFLYIHGHAHVVD